MKDTQSYAEFSRADYTVIGQVVNLFNRFHDGGRVTEKRCEVFLKVKVYPLAFSWISMSILL